MKLIFSKLIVFVFLWCVCFGCAEKKSSIPRTVFSIEKGINLNSWLEVKTLDSSRLFFVTNTSVDSLKNFGFDHVRIPVSEVNLFQDDLTLKENVLDVLTGVIDYCIAHNIKVIVDLHETKDHHFGANEANLFKIPSAKERFFLVWEKLQNVLKHYPVDMLAYECLNEPAASQKKHGDWNHLLAEWISLIRKKEPRRVLFIGSNRGNQLWTFKHLKLPKNDPNLVLTFHYYKPNVLTHYKAEWSSARYYDGPITYPGRTIPLDVFEILPDTLQKKYKYATKWYDIEVMRSEIKKAVDVANSYNLSLNVGEFGCRRPLPDSIRYKWLNDVVSVFRENKISYTLWGLRGSGFGIYNSEGSIDTDMITSVMFKN